LPGDSDSPEDQAPEVLDNDKVADGEDEIAHNVVVGNDDDDRV